MVTAHRARPSSFGSFAAVERSAGTTTALRGKEVAMKPSFMAGFGPIVRDVGASREFWGAGLGIQLQEASPSYWTNDGLDGVKAFALWPLAQAAESCFGGNTWPPEIPAPQAWVEFDVESPGGGRGGRVRTRGRGSSSAARSTRGVLGTDDGTPAEPRGAVGWRHLHALDAPHGQ